ncbi:MAG TPA: hypothetical protein VK165_05285 [Azonexus sp.]|nr:hypothetical protein [Azonexus sp.]
MCGPVAILNLDTRRSADAAFQLATGPSGRAVADIHQAGQTEEIAA